MAVPVPYNNIKALEIRENRLLEAELLYQALPGNDSGVVLAKPTSKEVDIGSLVLVEMKTFVDKLYDRNPIEALPVRHGLDNNHDYVMIGDTTFAGRASQITAVFFRNR